MKMKKKKTEKRGSENISVRPNRELDGGKYNTRAYCIIIRTLYVLGSDGTLYNIDIKS